MSSRVLFRLFAIGFLVLSGFHSFTNGQTVPQDRSKVIIFSHRLHAEDAGAECLDCHLNVDRSLTAIDNNLPTMAQCYSCHEEDDTDCEVCHVTDDYVEFSNPARDIKFNHSLHISKEGLDCLTCHKGINEVDLASSEQLPEMRQCMECHNEATASNDCAVCHIITDLTFLKPESHLSDWKFAHAPEAQFRLGDCSMCHQESFCEECHDADELITVGGDRTGSFSPNATKLGGSAGQSLNMVHAIDYRYTHSLDAKSKLMDCAVCHETNDFCSKCHNPEDDDHRFEPAWHGGADWGAIAGGVGSGGGRHGEMARRDMELCASCHDIDGEDPVCLSCHFDAVPGIGNDPKTHESDFMKDSNGEWHSDENYLCYNCHSVGRFQAGTGFCGYCHGPKEG